MNTITYLIPDMSCGHCKARIEKYVNHLPGIHSAIVYIDTKILTVTYHENETTNEEIIKAVEDAGYTAKQQ
uniref:heavy-metal-associated domain-containing protein n=1 Tax=Candidatus Enterococcus willemsii TaxID=1857215 RepID=UPI00403FBFAF